MAQSFMNQHHFYDLLQEVEAADFLQFGKDETFAAECSFLQEWNEKLNKAPEMEWLDDISVKCIPEDAPDSVYVTLIYGGEEVMIVYVPSSAYPGRPEVEIFYNTQSVYGRDAGQSSTINFSKSPFFG